MDPEQLITNALTKIENGNYAGAVLDLEAAIRLDPANPMAQNSLALARLAMGDSAGAVTAYRRAIELDPDDLDARMGCARALAASGEHNEAVSVLRQVLIADDGNPRPWPSGPNVTKPWTSFRWRRGTCPICCHTNQTTGVCDFDWHERWRAVNC